MNCEMNSVNHGKESDVSRLSARWRLFTLMSVIQILGYCADIISRGH